MSDDYYKTVRVILGMDIPSSAKIILIYLNDRIGDNGHCWPSITRIMSDCKLSRDTVVRSIRLMNDKGLLAVTRPSKPARENANEYTLNIPILTSTKIGPVRKSDQLNQYENRTTSSPILRTNQSDFAEDPVRKSDPNDSRTNQERIINVSSRETISKSASKPATNFTEKEFYEEFWPKVPHKIGRRAAWHAYVQARKRATAKDILAGLPGYAQYEEQRKAKSKDFRPLHPATWLNQDRWTDEIEPEPEPPEEYPNDPTEEEAHDFYVRHGLWKGDPQ